MARIYQVMSCGSQFSTVDLVTVYRSDLLAPGIPIPSPAHPMTLDPVGTADDLCTDRRHYVCVCWGAGSLMLVLSPHMLVTSWDDDRMH